jgi:glycosyltransferase involved in cell wall biosynthesis
VEDCWDVGSPRRIGHTNLHLILEAPWRCEKLVASKILEAPRDVVLVNQPLGYRAARAVRTIAPGTVFVARSHGWEPHVDCALRRSGPTGRGRSLWRRAASRALKGPLFRQNALLAERAHGLVVCSADDREWILRTTTVPSERILALEPGLPTEMLETPTAAFAPERARRLLYVGQFAAFKAPEVVARALGEVLTRVPDAEATWVCASRDHAVVRSLLPERCLSRFTLLDWMPRAELTRVYDEHGIFLFPSYFEGFAQTFLEAMARGLVVLASRVDGMGQTLRDGENGFLFAPGDADGIAARALELLGSSDTIARVGTNARNTASRFTWDRAAANAEAFFEDLLRMESDGRRTS